MPWLLTFTVNNRPHKAGDIIDICEEDKPNFGTKTMANPWFKIVHCPDMPWLEAINLVQPQVGFTNIPVTNPNLEYRAITLDNEKLTGLDKAAMQAPIRAIGLKFSLRNKTTVTQKRKWVGRNIIRVNGKARYKGGRIEMVTTTKTEPEIVYKTPEDLTIPWARLQLALVAKPIILP